MALTPNTPTPSPFQQMKPPTGPQITPATAKSTGQGGQAQPPYLQMRTPTSAPAVPNQPTPTQPVITPKPSVMGDTVNPANRAPTMQNNAPSITPANKPPQTGGTDLGGVYSFFKSDLENQAKQAKSNAISDASARGVYYGTPLTGSEADIDTQLQRGIGQLGAGMYSSEQQNQLARLGLASNLGWQGGLNAPPAPGPMDWSGLGALFSNSNPTQPNQTPGQAPATANRSGPVITPASGTKTGEGYSTPKKGPQIS